MRMPKQEAARTFGGSREIRQDFGGILGEFWNVGPRSTPAAGLNLPGGHNLVLSEKRKRHLPDIPSLLLTRRFA